MNISISDLTALQEMIFIVFTTGVVVGAICSGILSTIKSILFSEISRPTRIKTDSGYLYRFKNKYVTNEERIKQKQLFISRIKQKNKTSYSYLLTIFILILFILAQSFYLTKFTFDTL